MNTDQLFLLSFATHHIWPHSKFCLGLSSGLSVTLEQHALFTITTKGTPECQEALPLPAPLALGSLTRTRDTSPLCFETFLFDKFRILLGDMPDGNSCHNDTLSTSVQLVFSRLPLGTAILPGLPLPVLFYLFL